MAKRIYGVTVGTPVSPQVLLSKTKIDEKIANKVDGAHADKNGYLYLTSNGETVVGPLGPFAGSGGTSTIDVKVTNDSEFTSTTLLKGAELELAFTFSSLDDGVPTGLGTCQIIVNEITKSTFSIEQGANVVKVNQKWLNSGANTVKVKCTDVYGNYKMIVYDVTIIDIYLTSTFNDTATYDSTVQFKYIPYGEIAKTIHVLVDGREYYTENTSNSGRQTTVNIDGLAHGVHRLEAYIEAKIGTKPIESEHLEYDIMFAEKGNKGKMIASVYSTESVTQGEQVSIPFIVYDPSALSSDIELIISANGEQHSSKAITVDRSRQYWNVRNYPAGEVSFTIKCGDVEKTHVVNVAEADIDATPVTNDLELYLTSTGRSNNEANPGEWKYENVSTTFQNVNWDSTGWIADENGDTVLRLNGGATAEISFKPFAEDFKNYGKTIEVEFAIRDVNNREAVVLSCMNDNIGMEVTAYKAILKSEQSEISCNFCDEKRIRVSFVVESRSEYRLINIYLNGILSGTKQYPATDNFQQNTPVNITLGSPYCGVDIYTIRSYSNALTFTEVIENYISDITDMGEKAVVFEANDIYDQYGSIVYEEVKKKIPVMIIVGSLPQSKGDKKDAFVKFEHNTIPELNFEDSMVLDVQGTSSQWYVRKNYKGKTANAHQHDVGQIPSKVFCVKADYAEATSTHNTQNANLVETLYSEKTPAQLADERCRTTIYGYPIVIFHQETEDAKPVFIGKYNYNFDKGSEEVYGFDGSFDVESWEFKNNTSDACNFLAPIGSDWSEDFEARYPDKNTNISRFKRMHDWVVSTKGNVAKFKSEFENYFDLHFSLIYYVYTSVMLMVDQRAKNMFLTYWATTGKWQPWFYDNDTCLGINNEGRLVFDYYHEDIDTLDGANVYNGQNSTLWTNFREAFADEIKETYQNLRNNKKLTYDKIIEHFVTNGSEKWSESIYNEDADYKYISMLRSDNDATNLYQVRGDGEEHLEYFASNRLKYLDSKWYASDYADNYVSLRIYTPSEWAGVEPNADITIVPFSNMYAGVRYKANGTLIQHRVEKNEEVTFEAPNETFNDTETAIYGASEISSLGDLAPLYCGSINVSKASRLINLKVGDASEGYQNNNLTELSVGTNKLLKVVDIRNCPNLTEPLSLVGCPNVEEIYATGSGITGVELAKSGYLKKLHLPATITNLTLHNQLYIEDLTIEGYDAISSLNIENCKGIDVWDLFNKCSNIKRVRLIDVNWSLENADYLVSLVENGLKGIDENGLNVDIPTISGTCHIETLTGADMLKIEEYFPYLNITYTTLIATVTFMHGDVEVGTAIAYNGGDVSYNGDALTMESTAQYNYTFAGWSTEIGGEADENALKNVVADRVVYAVFEAELRTYNVYFYNLGTLVYTAENVPYGGSAVYLGDYPENNTTGNTADFLFTGWNPTPDNIVGETHCHAQYEDFRMIEDSWATIASNAINGTATSLYGLGTPKTLKLGEVKLPYDYYSGSAVVYNDEIHILGGSSNEKSHYKWDGTEWISVSTLPYTFTVGSAVVYDNEIHILGGSGNKTAHYKWNGTTWVSVSTLPYDFNSSSAVVYNDEIHILGGSSNQTAHYKWDGTEWTSVSTFPYKLYGGSAVVYDNEIHILGGYGNKTAHYKWDGTEWISASTLPVEVFFSTAVVYNGEIHILGGYDNQTAHYKWDGTEWTSVSTLPHAFYQGSAVVYDNKMYILGSDTSSSDRRTQYYWTGTEWIPIMGESLVMQVSAYNTDAYPDGVSKWCVFSSLPYNSRSSIAVVLNNEIHILGGSSNQTAHYKWDGTEWTSVSTLPYSLYLGSAVVYDNEIHILGGSSNQTAHYKWDGITWVSVSTLPYGLKEGSAIVFNGEIHIMGGNSSTSARKYHYKWNGSEWTSVSTLPHAFYQGSAVVYNDEINILGCSTGNTNHCKWNGSYWVTVSTLPNGLKKGNVVVLNNEVHMIGGTVNNTSYHKWNGSEWTSVSTLPFGSSDGPVVVFNDEICVLNAVDYTTAYVSKTEGVKATLTFVGKYLLKDKLPLTSLREYLNGEFISLLPSDLQTALTTVKKVTNGEVTNDKVWLLSAEEVADGNEIYPAVFGSRVRTTMDGTPSKWWLRTGELVDENGVIGTGDATEAQGVLIGFCIG